MASASDGWPKYRAAWEERSCQPPTPTRMPGTGSPDPAVRRLAEAPKLDPQQVPPAPIPGAVAKNEALYVILGLLIPGLPALLLKDDKATGGIQLGLWVVSWILAIFLIGFVLWIGVAIWSAMDGYQAAKLWNSRHGFVT
jgi:hypothetical protein